MLWQLRYVNKKYKEVNEWTNLSKRESRNNKAAGHKSVTCD